MKLLERIVRSAWTGDTSVNPAWSRRHAELGQCAVTALVIQDELGGDLLRVVNEGVSHYYNRLPDGREVDLTRDQFDDWDPSPAEERTRDYVLSFPATASRYALLRDRVDHIYRIARGEE